MFALIFVPNEINNKNNEEQEELNKKERIFLEANRKGDEKK